MLIQYCLTRTDFIVFERGPSRFILPRACRRCQPPPRPAPSRRRWLARRTTARRWQARTHVTTRTSPRYHFCSRHDACSVPGSPWPPSSPAAFSAAGSNEKIPAELMEVLQEVGRTGKCRWRRTHSHQTSRHAALATRCAPMLPCGHRLTAGAASPRRARADIRGRRWCP